VAKTPDFFTFSDIGVILNDTICEKVFVYQWCEFHVSCHPTDRVGSREDLDFSHFSRFLGFYAQPKL